MVKKEGRNTGAIIIFIPLESFYIFFFISKNIIIKESYNIKSAPHILLELATERARMLERATERGWGCWGLGLLVRVGVGVRAVCVK